MGTVHSACDTIDFAGSCARERVVKYPFGVDVQRYYSNAGEIGDGGYSTVWRCFDKSSGASLACKSVAKVNMPAWTSASLEADILAKLQTRPERNRIVRLYEIFEDTNAVHLVQEWCKGGDLHSRQTEVGRFEEHQAKRLFHQMVIAVRHVHAQHIVHRDLKLENWLLTAPSPGLDLRLCDFGLSIMVKPNEQLHERVGSPYYVAPEVLAGSYGMQVDVWSLGVILYIVLSGLPPFDGLKDQQIFAAILGTDVSFDNPAWADCSTAARDLLLALLEKNGPARPTAQTVFLSEWLRS